MNNFEEELKGRLAEAILRLRAMPVLPSIPGLIQAPAKWPIERLIGVANDLTREAGSFEEKRGFLEILFWAHIGLQTDDVMAKSEQALFDVCAALKRQGEAKEAALLSELDSLREVMRDEAIYYSEDGDIGCRYCSTALEPGDLESEYPALNAYIEEKGPDAVLYEQFPHAADCPAAKKERAA